ncbi:hypothetical protein [Streptomyces roseolus]|uniref:hypothetical protein n=1 Tax=Streptomyces roseolus TaxID=67358 RepID=UPI001672102E|nr:hypothetical protein [Streptomyces roseolus]GGR53954.1 hypothetical protein GCM10010282_53790 [Streptomyces roseolus]
MRIMLDNNIWSYLGDEQAGDRFKALVRSLGHRVVTPPGVLLEVLQHPRPDKREAIVRALVTGTDERLRSEADLEAEEVVGEVRRLRPEWARAVPDTGREASLRTFWTKTVWRRALDSHDLFREIAPARHADRTAKHLVDVQKTQQKEWRAGKFDVGDLSRITAFPSEETAPGPRLGWRPGDRIAAWRPLTQEVYWRYFAVGRRSVLTHEDATGADWVGARVDLRAMCASREEFNRFWLYGVDAANMPRNWLRWAAQTVQTDMKVTGGNPRDVQHASHLPDCDVFLTADKNFARVLDRIGRQAPVPVGRGLRVAPAAHGGVVEAVEAALRTL